MYGAWKPRPTSGLEPAPQYSPAPGTANAPTRSSRMTSSCATSAYVVCTETEWLSRDGRSAKVSSVTWITSRVAPGRHGHDVAATHSPSSEFSAQSVL